jgi:hexosaminidase
MRYLLLIAFVLSVPSLFHAQQSSLPATYPVIPKPASLEARPGTFVINEGTRVMVEEKSAVLGDLAAFLAARLGQSTGYTLPVVTGGRSQGLKNVILLALTGGKEHQGAEGYELTVNGDRVRVSGAAPAGVFYGLQTLFQLLPVEFEHGSPVYGIRWEIPGVVVRDAPRFSWRGMHLDVGRHFSSKASVMKYIDLLSRYKFNTFHWHLTDDQGWRVEIKKYPRLTEVGSWRRETLGDSQPVGGFYTQEEVKEVVAYAGARFITVVPEIEMPGHAFAALASYPELSCTGGPFQVQTVWGVFDDVFCAGNEKTFAFLEGVLGEVLELFPSLFIHIGGDECPKTRWKTCPKCQARIAREGLANEHELQSYVIRRIEKFLQSRGRRVIGWDEILEGGLAPNATVMSWRGIVGGIEAARAGHDVVMTPSSHCYLDYYQGLTGEPKAIGGYLTMEKVYSFEPVPAELNATEGTHILGVQGNVWTEYIPTFQQIEYMAFPRACALSEVAWTNPARKNFPEFTARLGAHFDRLTARGVNFRVPPPTGFEGTVLFVADTIVRIGNPVAGATIRYTLDGTEPTAASPRVDGPIPIGKSLELRARTFLPNGKASVVPIGYFSVIDPAVHGVSYRVFDGIRATRKEIELLPLLAQGSMYGVETEPSPLSRDSLTVLCSSVLDVEREGLYEFTLRADEKATLTVDGYPVATDSTTERWKQADGRVFLGRGPHRLWMANFRAGRRTGIDLQVRGPGLALQRIPAAMLRRE